MSRISAFNSPFVLGFDYVERILDHVAKSAGESYPPYNIEHLDAETLRITLAVAGFSTNELSVTVEDNQLIISGKQADDPDRIYLHRGIATRQFQRRFVLAKGIAVTTAHLDNGLLSIELKQPKPVSAVQTIEIKTISATTQNVENLGDVMSRKRTG